MAKRQWLENKLQSFAKWYAEITGIGDAKHLWKKLDRFRRDKLDNYRTNYDHDWRKRIYLSYSESIEFISKECAPQRKEIDKLLCQGLDVERIAEYVAHEFCMLAAWRACKDIVTFDKDLYTELESTVIGETLPSDIIISLPSWSIYFEAPGIETQGRRREGFFAYPQILSEKLYMILSFENPELSDSFLDGNFRKDADASFIDLIDGKREGQVFMIPITGQPFMKDIERLNKSLAEKYEMLVIPMPSHQIDKGLLHALNMLIYICSFGLHEKKDYKIGQEFRQPQRGEKKFNWRIFEAPQANVWEIGEEFGKTVRPWHKRTNKVAVSRSPIRPHMRRSH